MNVVRVFRYTNRQRDAMLLYTTWVCGLVGTRQAFQAWEHKVRKHQVNCTKQLKEPESSKISLRTPVLFPKLGKVGERIVH